MNSARVILVTFICAGPPLLLVHGAIVRGLVPAILACGIAVVSSTMREGESAFLLKVMRSAATLATVPVLWMLLQVLPLGSVGLAHPIWQSAEQALGSPIRGSISIDPGVTLLALGQYVSAVAVALLTAAVAVERRRAEWVLFALVVATALVAALSLGHDLIGFSFLASNINARSQVTACAALGVICSVAATIGAVERFETGHPRPDSSIRLTRTIIACTLAFALCLLALRADIWIVMAYGLGMLLATVAIRRLGLGVWGRVAITSMAGIVTIALIASRPAIRSTEVTLAFASNSPGSAISITERMLADVPWTGTGAGTFALLMPSYESADESAEARAAPTTAAGVAIELGRPMLWAVVIGVIAGIVALLRGALARRRDAFYAAAAASSMLLLLLMSFCDNGVLGAPVAICAAAIIGLGLAQSQSRTIA